MHVHFSDKNKIRPKKLEDLTLAYGEWAIKPYWSAERERGDPRYPETPRLEDEDGSTELPQFLLVMLRAGYQVPWVYQRFG